MLERVVLLYIFVETGTIFFFWGFYDEYNTFLIV